MAHYMQNPAGLKSTKIANGVFELVREDGTRFSAHETANRKAPWLVALIGGDTGTPATVGSFLRLAEAKSAVVSYALPVDEAALADVSLVIEYVTEADLDALEAEAAKAAQAEAETFALEAPAAEDKKARAKALKAARDARYRAKKKAA